MRAGRTQFMIIKRCEIKINPLSYRLPVGNILAFTGQQYFLNGFISISDRLG
jgi:hypothetical protein